ncbi:MAG: lipoate--protein ligase [Anaerolineales bacterium]|nr:lipoate--protein ligase [Anaerolineales bacterium]
MLFVDNAQVTDPRINLAIEEHLLRNVKVAEPILLFYINEPAVIIGRNQNTLEEIDPDYIEAHGIHVVRRLSGGGAVFHDFGNLNFSFITTGREDLHNFHKFTQPVVKVLRGMGIDAELRAKSSLFANNKKISGNAQFLTGDRMFSHGTLLFDSNIEMLLHALNPRQVKIESKAVQSVRSVVMNLREALPPEMDIYAFREALLQGVFDGPDIPTYDLTDEDWATIRQVSAERYQTWEWNIGRSPKFNVQKTKRFPVGKVDIRIDVERGRIKGVKVFGDFAGKRLVAELEALLLGVRYDKEVLTEALQDYDVSPYFGELETGAFLELLY